MHHPRRRNVITCMVGLKNSHIPIYLIQNGEPQRCSWEHRKIRQCPWQLVLNRTLYTHSGHCHWPLMIYESLCSLTGLSFDHWWFMILCNVTSLHVASDTLHTFCSQTLVTVLVTNAEWNTWNAGLLSFTKSISLWMVFNESSDKYPCWRERTRFAMHLPEVSLLCMSAGEERLCRAEAERAAAAGGGWSQARAWSSWRASQEGAGAHPGGKNE